MLPPTPKKKKSCCCCCYYKFPQQDTDDELKVTMDELVAFGDMDDASRVTPQYVNFTYKGLSGDIDTVRKFFPGQYKVTVIQLYRGIDPLVIFHHELVDPNLLAIQIIRLIRDYGGHYHTKIRSKHILSPYDWCIWTHFNNPRSMDNYNLSLLQRDYNKAHKRLHDDLFHLRPKRRRKGEEKSTLTLPNDDACDGIYFTQGHFHRGRYLKMEDDDGNEDIYPLGPFLYFTNVKRAVGVGALAKIKNTPQEEKPQPHLRNFILQRQIKKSSKIKYLYALQNDEGENVSLGVYFPPFNSGDWPLGQAFKDAKTHAYFALVINGRLWHAPKVKNNSENSDPPSSSSSSWAWTEEIIQKEGLERYFIPLKNNEELNFSMTDFLIRE